MAMITLCGKNGPKCMHGMNWNTTSMIMGRTYTTKQQDFSEATVSYSSRDAAYDPHNNTWYGWSKDRHNVPISEAIKKLAPRPDKEISVHALQIKMQDKVVYEITLSPLGESSLSAAKVRAFLNLYLEHGIDPLPTDIGKKHLHRTNE